MIDIEVQSLILKLWNDPDAFSLGELAQLQRLLDEGKKEMNAQVDQVMFNKMVSLNS